MKTKTKRPSHKSYCEASGRTPFNWGRFLRRKRYTVAELEKARRLSGEWVTCACGNQCDVIPRNTIGEERYLANRYVSKNEPLDDQLGDLGMQFHQAIVNLQVDIETPRPFLRSRNKAASILRRIERRSAKLVRAYYASL